MFIDYFVTDYRSLEMLNAFKKMAAYCHVKSRGHRIIVSERIYIAPAQQTVIRSTVVKEL